MEKVLPLETSLPEMGASSPPVSEWRESLRDAIRDPDVLCDRLGLDENIRRAAREAARRFGLVVPREFLERIEPGNPSDPLLRQVLPIASESESSAGFVADPVGDLLARQAPGLLRKYHGRALLLLTGTCAIHCRYCFRREYPYADEPRGLAQWEPALDAIARDPSLEEVIFSGGDPLTLTDGWLGELARRLARVPHLRRIRLHTRLPIAIPSRVNDELLAWLKGTRLAPVVVVHANHPDELDERVAAALGRLVDAGIPVLNQAVLLRGINDDAPTLEALCRRLVDLRVMPYYLHQLDPVVGAGHFFVPVERGRQILRELRARLPGYALPRYVQEQAGAASKLPLE